MIADGVNKDRRVARIKVDGIAFGTMSALLSANYSTTAFRVSGDRFGGSSIYSVDVASGKYVQVAASKTSAEGIGAYAWSPAGNTMAYVRSAPAPDPADANDAYGTIYLFSVGFKAMRLANSNGHDRLLGFSGDGLGVYVSRQEQAGNDTLEHLVYLPISGGPAQVLLKSQPGLMYSQFTVWKGSNASDKAAFLAEGNFSLSGSKNAGGKLAGPNGLGLGVAYIVNSAAEPTLIRRDAEPFKYMAWSPDGTSLLMGGGRSGASWAADMAGNRRAINTPLIDMSVVTWSNDANLVVLSDSPTTRLVTVNYGAGSVASTRYVGVAAKAGPAVIRLAVPYVHQVRDLAENGNGNWACGPTSVAMALAYYGKLEPWTEQVAGDKVAASPSSPTNTASLPAAKPASAKPLTGADIAPYVTNKYTAFGHTYDSASRDPSGNMLAGLYGTIVPSGLASWQQMASVLQWHGLSSRYVALSWDGIVGALKRGHPVLLGTMLTSEGHILLVTGYTADGNLIVNDPYGNRFQPGYGANNGNGITYQWKKMTPRHALEIVGTIPKK